MGDRDIMEEFHPATDLNHQVMLIVGIDAMMAHTEVETIEVMVVNTGEETIEVVTIIDENRSLLESTLAD